jgi:phospholipid-binding lipoprotein MlaA
MTIILKNSPQRSSVRSRSLAACGLVAVLMLTACGPATAPDAINDPSEAQNRQFHDFNVDLDKHILRPAGTAYAKNVPKPVAQGISNFASNLDLPGEVVNDVLQLRLGRAAQNTLRFALNTTIGLGGLMDPATKLGVDEKPTDFGETLHLWGMPEGQYIEMPVLGPTTDRDLLGSVVDFAMNPVRLVFPKPLYYTDTLARLSARIGERGRYSETVDSLLYDSADGYAQTRLLYLENRRYQLGQPAMADTIEDPYAQ